MPDDWNEFAPTREASGGLSRRALLRRGLVLGAAPLAAGLLAACGGSSSSPTATSAGTAAATTTAQTTPSALATPVTTATPAAAATASPAATVAASPVAVATATSQPSAAQYTVEPAQNKGGQLVAGSAGDAKTLNPVTVTDSPSYACIFMIFEGVMQTDPTNGTPAGLLAKSWDISQDGITYSFVLNDGVTWQDGQPFSANDVKFTYDLLLNPDASSAFTSTLAAAIKSVDVADDSHVTVTLKQANASFLANQMYYQIVPQHILKDVAPKDLAADAFSTGQKGRTIGTGPFMFDEWVKDDHMTLLKNPSYWRGAPNLDKWIFKVVPNQTVLTQQLKTGEIDVGGIQPPDAADMKKQSNITVAAFDTTSFVYYAYQLDTTKTTLFQDKAVRQALFYALDRQAMVDAVYFGYARVAIGTMPVIYWAYDPDAIKLKYPFDPDKANSLLDQAGWKAGSDGIREKDGKKLSFSVLTTPAVQAYVDLTSIMQEQWKKIGVDCKPQQLELNAFLAQISDAHNFDMYLVGFGFPGSDPDQSLIWPCAAYKGGFNLTKYCNPQVDKLLQDGLATTDQDKRKQLYDQMQNILMDDLPQAIMFFPQEIVGMTKRLHNYFPNQLNGSFNAHLWWVDAS
ncbi:MAG TPA: ABC transporter substrate-binding protein [Thermomicrobiaceae bacterium]|nr:ABC transporter substrate-binding protein [Thermomicrobiaceae bacterium]